MTRAILTQREIKQYIAQTLLAFRQDVSREMAACGEALEITSDFSGVLYELGQRFELDPGQQALACGSEVYGQYSQPAASQQLPLPVTASALVAAD